VVCLGETSETLYSQSLLFGSDSVSRFNDSDLTRVTLRKMVIRDSSQSHFYKISEFLMDKPSSLAHKKMRIFCFSDDQDWGKFYVLALVVLCCILRIKCPLLTYRETWDFGFTEGSAGHNMLIPYRGSVLYLHIVIMAVDLIRWPWVFSRYQYTSKVI